MIRRALVVMWLLAAACGPGMPSDPAPVKHAPQPFPHRPLPAHFPPLVEPADNPTTVPGAALGRQLYYDVRLSPDGSRACADCHLQARAFSTPHVRSVLPHMNLAWSRVFLWDGSKEGTLEDVMRFEVNTFFGTDVQRLDAPDLRSMFEDAFGSPEPSLERAALALAQFQRTMVTADSRYDRFVAGDTSALDASEQRGLRLFNSERAECFHCHAPPLFTDGLFHNNGLDKDVAGKGRARVSGRRQDDGAFKTPTLRNVAVTGPFMHDDRFETLEEVIAFYSSSVQPSHSVSTTLANPFQGGAHLSPQEQADLVAFLRALSDETFLTDPALGPPPGLRR